MFVVIVDTEAAAHARAYHDKCVEISTSEENPAPDYRVWEWDEMPAQNKALLMEASRRFLLDMSQSSIEYPYRALGAAVEDLNKGTAKLDALRLKLVSLLDKYGDLPTASNVAAYAIAGDLGELMVILNG